MKKTGLNGYEHKFSVDISDTVNIRKNLMKKRDIK